MESWLLSIAGASLGLVLAWYLKEVIERLLFPAAAGLSVTVPMDWRVLGLTALVAVATGTLAALAPGWLMARARGLPSQGRTTTWSGAPRLRGSLGVVQLAFSLTLLVSALLLVATLRNLRAVDLGLDPRDVHVVAFNLDQHGYDSPRALAYHRAVLPSLRSTGEFEAVSVATRAPFGSRSSVGVIPPGGEPQSPGQRRREWRQRRLLPPAVDPDPARPGVHRRGCVGARPARAGGRERTAGAAAVLQRRRRGADGTARQDRGRSRAGADDRRGRQGLALAIDYRRARSLPLRAVRALPIGGHQRRLYDQVAGCRAAGSARSPRPSVPARPAPSRSRRRGRSRPASTAS